MPLFGGEPSDIMERRRSLRITVAIPAEVEIYPDSQYQTSTHTSIKGMVNTIDIGLGGLSVRVVHCESHTGKGFSPAIAYLLAGKIITAYFKDYDMTITGKVVRVDPETMLMAVVITRVSDIDCWRQLCGQVIYRQSSR
ncbi:MAG TPA: PilZ domain-containing protein [Deltaproteobacteria bacterium]|nr:PilZ domain-containing protein [Deltaproteobacteria bacterium]